MFIVKNDQADVPFSINAPTVTDAEGEPVAAGDLDYVIESSDPEVVSLQINEDGVSGVAHFGHSGQAAINVNVFAKATGALLGAFGAQFTVTVGDPAAISGGTILFEGLTES